MVITVGGRGGVWYAHAGQFDGERQQGVEIIGHEVSRIEDSWDEVGSDRMFVRFKRLSDVPKNTLQMYPLALPQLLETNESGMR